MHASPGRFSVSTGKLGAAMALNEPECLAVALSGPQTHNGRLGPHWAPIHVYTGHWSQGVI